METWYTGHTGNCMCCRDAHHPSAFQHCWHDIREKNIVFLAEVCFCSDMYVDFPAESIKWSMGIIMKSRQTKAKLGNIARKTGDIPHAIVLAYLPTKTRVIVEVVLSVEMIWDSPFQVQSWIWIIATANSQRGSFLFPIFDSNRKWWRIMKNP